MVYKYMTPQMKLLGNHQFVNFNDLRVWARRAVHVEFYTASSRARVRSTYIDIQMPSRVFSSSQRFPETGYYAKLGNSEIGKAVTSALRALDLPTIAGGPICFKHVPFDLLAIKRSYENALHKVIEIIDCHDPEKLLEYGVYSRKTFETKYALTWHPSRHVAKT